MNDPDTFDLRLWRPGDGSLIVEGRRGGDKWLRASVPYPNELAPTLEKDSPLSSEQPVVTGRRLHDLLLPDPLREAFVSARHRARQRDRLLRVQLNIEDPALGAWPWEVAVEPAGTFLALDSQTSVVRYHPGDGPATQPSTQPALLLADNCSRENEDSKAAQAMAQQALQPLLNAGRLSADSCRRAMPERLERALATRTYAVLHLIGELADKTFQPMVNTIADSSVALAILQPCAPASPETGRRRLIRFAHMLVEAGVPAALTAPSEMGAVSMFLSTLYVTLAAGHPLDQAVTQARITTARSEDAIAGNWALATMLARAPGLRLWSAAAETSSPAARSVASRPSSEAGIRFAGKVDIQGDFVGGHQSKQSTELGDVGLMRDSEIGTRQSAADPPEESGAGQPRDSGDSPSIQFEDDVQVGGDMVAGDQTKHETRIGDIGLARGSQIGNEGNDAETAGPDAAMPAECPHCGAEVESGYRYCHKCGRPLLESHTG